MEMELELTLPGREDERNSFGLSRNFAAFADLSWNNCSGQA